MKRSLLLIFCTIFLSLSASAQIPNNSFETWVSAGNYEVPASWGTMNHSTAAYGIYTVTKATPGMPGSYYMKVTSKTINGSVVPGIAVSGVLDTITKKPISGFPFTSRPSAFTGKWQHMVYGLAQGEINVALTKWNTSTETRDTVALAAQTLSGMVMSWGNFSISFSYNSGDAPDSCIIELRASGATATNLDYIWVDNLAFNGTVAGLNETAGSINSISLYPNPAISNININYEIKKKSSVILEIRSIDGKLILTKKVGEVDGNQTTTLDISSFVKGTYFANIVTNDGQMQQSFVVN
jgi:hypothetical protein